MLFHTVGKMQGNESPDEIYAKHPFLDPRTWDSWEELDSEETGRRVDMLEDTLSSSLKY